VTVLLDTHACLWFVLGDRKLSAPARRLIETHDTIVLISPASYWEIAIKVSLGRYQIDMEFETVWNAGISDNGFGILPTTPLHAAEISKLPSHHRDPFERVLVAQSIVEQAGLVNVDPIFDSYGIDRIW
jgi:PIN domain nuclease of toxin-antitoxin system